MPDYADKIAKLLRKAESTTFDEERDALIAKAQHLMTVYAIDEAMLAQHGDAEREEIMCEMVTFTGVYMKDLAAITCVVAHANGVQPVLQNLTWKRPAQYGVSLNGFEGDVRRVRLLDTSLQLQCSAALQSWAKSPEGIQSWMTAMQKFKARRSFILGFSYGLRRQLEAAKRAGQEEAVKSEATRTDTTEAEASESVALVLRARADQVSDWVDQQYGRLTYVNRRVSGGGMNARAAGESAGRRASVSDGLSGGSRGALNA